MNGLTDILFAPLISWPPLVLFAAAAVALVGFSAWRRARGAWLRAIPLAALILALANPRLAGEDRQPLDDVAVVLVDDSLSQEVGDRRKQTDEALAALRTRMERMEGLEVRVERVRPPVGDDDGTRLFAAAERAVADVPRSRLAGVVMLTDGQVHDAPTGAEGPLGNAPVHALLTGRPDERDRRLVVEQAPSFGLVGGTGHLSIRIDDGAAARGRRARLKISRDGGQVSTVEMAVGQTTPLEIPIDHGGPVVVELEAEAGPEELTLLNNRAAVSINGVRDRLRVLLVSGQPHAGERTWRNLLKADPAVDLVHFTILRPPEKDDRTPIKELALISFPVRELFEERLNDFDLIIFDRYNRRGVLPANYYENLAEYVRGGGALLFSLGPEYGEAISLFNSPLEEILPAEPTGEVVTAEFLPTVTDIGRRHPVTAGLPGGEAQPPAWGRWLRQVGIEARSGTVVMAGDGGRPLLVLDHVGEGRVAQLLSDTLWLWARGYEGGGPHQELLRRLAHWLMKEPELEENMLRAEVRDGELRVVRRSLEAGQARVSVTLPNGTERQMTLTDQSDGRATGAMPIDQPGLYRVGDGSRVAIAAAGSIAPIEMQEVAATTEKVKPAVEASGGGIHWLSQGVPDVRRVRPQAAADGRGWIGLRANGEHTVMGVREIPLMPAAAALLLAFGGLILAWRREGR